MSTTTHIERHGGQPAVCVKDRELYAHTAPYAALIAQLPEDAAETIYQGVLADFWQIAGDEASERGYGGVWSEGRSGGWLIVSNPPDLDACEPCYGESSELCDVATKWLDFAGQIRAEMMAAREMFAQRLSEAVAELEARRESNIVRGEN